MSAVTTSTERPPAQNRTTTPALRVAPETLKQVLEACGYVATAANPSCWVMARAGCRLLQIPRLGRTVETEALYSTLAKAGIGSGQFFRMCQIATAPQGSDQPVCAAGGAR